MGVVGFDTPGKPRAGAGVDPGSSPGTSTNLRLPAACPERPKDEPLPSQFRRSHCPSCEVAWAAHRDDEVGCWLCGTEGLPGGVPVGPHGKRRPMPTAHRHDVEDYQPSPEEQALWVHMGFIAA